ncbi:MAG TPA: hypothetical protein VGH64_01785 [Puia sp.]|jgi:modulator of FtsH protease
MEAWHDFFVASAGAAAALMGLLFVGLSINLEKIITIAGLADRSLIALVLLFVILIQTLLLLVPHESTGFAGIAILVIGLFAWFFIIMKDIMVVKKTEKEYMNNYLFKMTLNQIALLPYFAAGIPLLNGNISGLYFLAVSIIFSFLKVSLDAWVLLVEINR